MGELMEKKDIVSEFFRQIPPRMAPWVVGVGVCLWFFLIRKGGEEHTLCACPAFRNRWRPKLFWYLLQDHLQNVKQKKTSKHFLPKKASFKQKQNENTKWNKDCLSARSHPTPVRHFLRRHFTLSVETALLVTWVGLFMLFL